MMELNPFIEPAVTDLDDQSLAAEAQNGKREALEALIARHQRWIYNIVLRMVYHPMDAEDATRKS